MMLDDTGDPMVISYTELGEHKKEAVFRLIDGVMDNGSEPYAAEFLNAMNANVRLPFEAKFMSLKFVVKRFVLLDGETILARGELDNDHECNVDLGNVAWPETLPDGFDWVLAYSVWMSSQI